MTDSECLNQIRISLGWIQIILAFTASTVFGIWLNTKGKRS